MKLKTIGLILRGGGAISVSRVKRVDVGGVLTYMITIDGASICVPSKEILSFRVHTEGGTK